MSKEELLLVRKDISISKIFNLAILSSVVSLSFARLFYIISNPNPIFKSILGFIAFTYYSGLSLIGGIAGGLLFVAIYSQYKKYPTGRIIDLFSVAILGCLPIGYVINFLLALGKTDIASNVLMILVTILSLFLIKGVYKLSEKGEIRDGSFTLIFLSVFSLSFFLVKLFVNLENFSFLKVENLLSFAVIFISLILLLNQEIMNKVLGKK